MYTTVAQNKFCENVNGLLFADIPSTTVVLYKSSSFRYVFVDWSSHGRPDRAQTRY